MLELRSSSVAMSVFVSSFVVYDNDSVFPMKKIVHIWVRISLKLISINEDVVMQRKIPPTHTQALIPQHPHSPHHLYTCTHIHSHSNSHTKTHTLTHINILCPTRVTCLTDYRMRLYMHCTSVQLIWFSWQYITISHFKTVDHHFPSSYISSCSHCLS